MSFEKQLKAGRRRPIFTPGETTRAVSLGRREIEQLVPHRDPFLLVDRITAVDLEVRAAIGVRRIDPADPILAGHFPGEPIYPGFLMLEMMGQLGLCLNHLVTAGRVEVLPADEPKPVRLLRLHGALFLGEGRPGDELTIVSQLVDEGGYTAILAGQVMKDDAILAVAIMEAFLPED
jgi:3-hydroxymyristoyl/3-hydroxydecanoyl-(acyl carrier protein) dehydratase